MSHSRVFCIVVCMLFCGALGSYSLQTNGKIFPYQPKGLLKNQIPSADDMGKMVGWQEMEVAPKCIDDFSPKDLARSIATSLRDLSSSELAIPTIQEIYDERECGTAQQDDKKRIKKLAEQLNVKFSKILSILNATYIAVLKNAYAPWSKADWQLSVVYPCYQHCQHDEYEDLEEKPFKSKSRLGCDPQHLGLNTTNQFTSNLPAEPPIKLKYYLRSGFLTSDVPLSSFPPCDTYSDTHLQNVFREVTSPRNIVILFDHGRALSSNQLVLGKEIVEQLVKRLSHHSKVGLLALSNNIITPFNDTCSPYAMPFATRETKFRITKFLDGLERADGPTNHSLGFRYAFEMIQHSAEENSGVFVIYLSRGLLNSLKEARVVLETIAHGHQTCGHNVTIATCALIDDGKHLTTEIPFLKDVANQNFSKHNISVNIPVTPGPMLAVNSTDRIKYAVAHLLEDVLLHQKRDNTYYLPYFEDMVLSVVRPIAGGAVGADVYFDQLLDDDVSFSTFGNSYVYLIDKKGLTMMHPVLARPLYVSEPPVYLDILYLENRPGFDQIRSSLLNSTSGSVKVPLENGTKSVRIYEALDIKEHDREPVLPDLVDSLTSTYTWHHLQAAPLVVVIVSLQEGSQNPTSVLCPPHSATLSSTSKLAYHRVDLLSQGTTLCRHLHLPAALDKGSLFLATSCFQSPFKFFQQPGSLPAPTVRGYLAFLRDNTRLLANPGLRPGVRSDVAVLSKIVDHWQNLRLNGKLRNYIVRRYIATPSGVLVAYPGSPLEESYNPARRPWYVRALEYPGRVVLTAPYLDVGGAGYIVTLSYTISERSQFLPDEGAKKISAVAAMDLTVGYFGKMLTEAIPSCNQNNTKCFLMDDKGYLISHPSLDDTSELRRAEKQHITHRESLIAHDILNHKGLVTKRVCNNFLENTMQRYYQFNVSVEGVLTNLVHGEHCLQYQLMALPSTNVFLGIVNKTCDENKAFCPCSRASRDCLNCGRVEQTECECPCECELAQDECLADVSASITSNPTCFNIQDHRPQVYLTKYVSDLQSCFTYQCESFKSQRDCQGVVGCEWCEYDRDARSPLFTSFCTSHLKCFNGVLDSTTPYEESTLVVQPIGRDPPSNAMGPVAGGILGFFLALMLVLVLYCYKQHTQRSQGRGFAHACLSALPDAGMRMSQLNNEMDEGEASDDMITGQNNVITPISPYLVNAGYKRPAGGDSDHGYSTMTPHDDSEPLTSTEPMGLSRSTSRSFTHSSLQDNDGTPSHQTMLPGSCHRVLAPVTVHMVDV